MPSTKETKPNHYYDYVFKLDIFKKENKSEVDKIEFSREGLKTLQELRRYVYKLADQSRGQPEGFHFNSYYTKV